MLVLGRWVSVVDGPPAPTQAVISQPAASRRRVGGLENPALLQNSRACARWPARSASLVLCNWSPGAATMKTLALVTSSHNGENTCRESRSRPVARPTPIPLRCMRHLPIMRRDYIKWYSPSLHRDMELLVFGERGFPFVPFPTSGGRFYEYEDRGMVNALRPKIHRGESQVICVDSVDQESWYNRSLRPEDRLHRQNAFDAY